MVVVEESHPDSVAPEKGAAVALMAVFLLQRRPVGG
jgi:hypothetical protein